MIATLRTRNFESNYLFLCMIVCFSSRLGKLKTHWLGPYVVKEITDSGVMKLEKLVGTEVRGLVNGSRLKPYFDRYDLVTKKNERERKENKKKIYMSQNV